MASWQASALHAFPLLTLTVCTRRQVYATNGSRSATVSEFHGMFLEAANQAAFRMLACTSATGRCLQPQAGQTGAPHVPLGPHQTRTGQKRRNGLTRRSHPTAATRCKDVPFGCIQMVVGDAVDWLAMVLLDAADFRGRHSETPSEKLEAESFQVLHTSCLSCAYAPAAWQPCGRAFEPSTCQLSQGKGTRIQMHFTAQSPVTTGPAEPPKRASGCCSTNC